MLNGIKETTPYAINRLAIFVKKHLDDNPTDAAPAVLTAIKAYDTASQNRRIAEGLERMVSSYSLESSIGGILTTPTVTAAGSGYSINDNIVVTGDGSGANIKVATVSPTGGILTLEVISGGSGYTTATLDLTGSGDKLATATITASPITIQSEVDIINTLMAGL